MPKISISNQLAIHQAKAGNDSPPQSTRNSRNSRSTQRSTAQNAVPQNGGTPRAGNFEKTVETAHKNMQIAHKMLVLIGENLRISGDKENELERERMRSGKSRVAPEQGRSLKINVPIIEAELHRAFSEQLKISAKGLEASSGIRAASSTTAASLPVNATASLGAASTKVSTSASSIGFRSIEEMVGNGLYTPAHGSQMMTPAGSTASATTTQTAGSVLGGVAGLYSMLEGGMTVAAANRVGGQAGRQAGSMGGLTAGLGAGMLINSLGIALGPIGWGALLVGAMVGGGLIGSRLGDRDRWKTEGKRLGKLLEQGVQIPEEMLGAMTLTRGRSKEELVNPNYARDFVGKTDQGFVNNKFALSRNEKDLQPEDIWGYAAFFEKFGNDWLGKFSEDQRRTIAQAALDSGAVREKHGTININWKPELETKIKELSASKD